MQLALRSWDCATPQKCEAVLRSCRIERFPAAALPAGAPKESCKVRLRGRSSFRRTGGLDERRPKRSGRARGRGGLAPRSPRRLAPAVGGRAGVPRGSDRGPNPYDLLLASLGACTAMTVTMHARRKGIPLGGVTARLKHAKIHADDCAACETDGGRIDAIELSVELEGSRARSNARSSWRSPTSARCTAPSPRRRSSPSTPVTDRARAV